MASAESHWRLCQKTTTCRGCRLEILAQETATVAQLDRVLPSEGRYGFGKPLKLGFDEAIDKVTTALQAEGFGVLSDIDVAAKMKEKLAKDVRAGLQRVLEAI